MLFSTVQVFIYCYIKLLIHHYIFFIFRCRKQMDKAIIHDPLRMRRLRHASKHCERFLRKILQKNPDDRLGALNDFEEIKAHVFFSSIDFDKLEKREIVPPFVPEVQSDDSTENIDSCFLNSVMEETSSYGFSAFVSTSRDNKFEGFSYAPPMLL